MTPSAGLADGPAVPLDDPFASDVLAVPADRSLFKAVNDKAGVAHSVAAINEVVTAVRNRFPTRGQVTRQS